MSRILLNLALLKKTHANPSMSKHIVVAGGGPSGLIAAWVFLNQHPGTRVTLLEPGKLGGEFLSGGLKYLRYSEGMVSLLEDLGVDSKTIEVRGGIFLDNKVHPYPAYLKELGEQRARSIQQDHYKKTRGISSCLFSSRSMNDPFSDGPELRLACEGRDLIGMLFNRLARLKGFEYHRTGLRSVLASDNVLTHGTTGEDGYTTRSHLSYDYLILTLPLWVLRGLLSLSWSLPVSEACQLNILEVKPPYVGDRFSEELDYVYTPYTPKNRIHRISKLGLPRFLWQAEVSGTLDVGVRHDLEFLFGPRVEVFFIKKGLKGHLLPLIGPLPLWPNNVAPLGRYAEWDSRSTVDTVLEKAQQLAQKWLG